MGSSSSSRLGARSSRRQSATRRRSPPESVETSASRRRQPQRVHRVFELRVEVPGVGGFDLGLHLGELVGGLLGVVRGELVEAVEQRLGLGDAVLDVAEHVLALVEVGLLLEHPDARARRERGLAAVLLIDAGHDPQQRRLAGAVVAEHPDLGARVEGERELR